MNSSASSVIEVSSRLQPFSKSSRVTSATIGGGATVWLGALLVAVARLPRRRDLAVVATPAQTLPLVLSREEVGVLLAAVELDKFFPMLTTAAGTIRPATVLVIGAGLLLPKSLLADHAHRPVFVLFLGVAMAIFLTQDFLPPRLAQLFRTVVELLAAIPSVVYGLWGLFTVPARASFLLDAEANELTVDATACYDFLGYRYVPAPNPPGR